jgi:hypothetical protein
MQCTLLLITDILVKPISTIFEGQAVQEVLDPLFYQFLFQLQFFDKFSKKLQLYNFKKFRLMRAKLFHWDRRTAMTKLIAVFRNCCNIRKLINKLSSNTLFIESVVTATCFGILHW